MKPNYTHGVERAIWNWIKNHAKADKPHEKLANHFYVGDSNAKKLIILYGTGARDSFNHAVYEMFDNSPTPI